MNLDGHTMLWIIGIGAVLGALIWIGMTLHRLTQLLARIGVHLVLVTTGQTHLDMMKAAEYTDRNLDNLYGPDVQHRYPLHIFRVPGEMEDE